MRSELVRRDVRIQTQESGWREDKEKRQEDVEKNVSQYTAISSRTTSSSETKKENEKVKVADHITFVGGDTNGLEDGSNEQPYRTIEAGVANAGENNTIFVYEKGGTATGKPGDADGGGSYDEQVVLREGQTLTSSIRWDGGTYATKKMPVIKPTTVTKEESFKRGGKTYSSLSAVFMAANSSVRRMAIDTTTAGFTANTGRYCFTSAISSHRGDTTGESLTMESNRITAGGDYARGILVDGYRAEDLSSAITNNTITTEGKSVYGIWFQAQSGTPHALYDR